MCEDEDECSSVSGVVFLGLLVVGMIGAVVYEENKDSWKEKKEEKAYQRELLERKIVDGRKDLKRKLFELEKDKRIYHNTLAKIAKLDPETANKLAQENSNNIDETTDQLFKEQDILPRARVVGVTPNNIVLIPNNDELKINYYSYQQITFNKGSANSQEDFIVLATKEVLPIHPGVSYKVYYAPLKEINALDMSAGRQVLTENGLYKHIIQSMEMKSAEKLIVTNNPLYNRKLTNVEGVIDSVKLVK